MYHEKWPVNLIVKFVRYNDVDEPLKMPNLKSQSETGSKSIMMSTDVSYVTWHEYEKGQGS